MFRGISKMQPTGNPLVRWLRSRFKSAIDLHADGKLSRGELERAENDAVFGRFTGPLMLHDGSFLDAEESKVAEIEKQRTEWP